MKAQILDQLGFAPKEQFPVFADRMPVQLLAYLRLSRIADPALFAKVSFEQDVVLSDLNEYEVLQLLMGDCREKIAKYGSSSEEDVKSLQNPKLSPQERLALRLVSGEKKILNSTMEAVRRRLAPIRGIPTKSGQLQDPNADFNEMFAMIEDLPNQPKKLIDGFLGWARGDYDPEWQKMQAKKKARQPPPK